MAHSLPITTRATNIIYGNLTPLYPKGPYVSYTGYTIAGPGYIEGEQFWVGTPFTPTAAATAKTIKLAVSYNGGTNAFAISINADTGGTGPGAALWTGTAANVEDFATCCAIASATIAPGLKLKAGITYWVVVFTDPTTSNDFYGVWDGSSKDQLDLGSFATNTGSGWSIIPTNDIPAFEIDK